MTSAASRSTPFRISAARCTSTPRIRSRTWRALEADIPLWRWRARAPGRSCRLVAERTRGGELAQLVANHGLGHVDRHVTTAVVHGDGVAHHVRNDGGAT